MVQPPTNLPHTEEGMHAQRAARLKADAQLGLVTRQQLLGCRLSPDQVKQLIRSGDLLVVHAGVYRIPGAPRTREQIALAACLACGPIAFGSERTAGELWSFIPPTTHDPVVAVPSDVVRRVRGIDVRRTKLLTPMDKTVRGKVPITTPARTLIDLGGVLGDEEFEAAFDEALRIGVLRSPELVLSLLARPGMTRARGSALIRRIAKDRLVHGVPEFELERRMIRLIKRYALPAPVRHVKARIKGRNVDFDLAYPERKVVVEVEGRAPHWGKRQWQKDHDRRNAVFFSEWRLLYFTWRDVTECAAQTAMVLAEALGLVPSRWRTA